jgi:dTDP-4-amino-4,6-dideoxygalactose transaminase
VRSPRRDALREHLDAAGVSTAVHYPIPIHLAEAYAGLGLSAGSLPVVERLAEQSCTLPLFPGMTQAQVDRVLQGIRTFDEGES